MSSITDTALIVDDTQTHKKNYPETTSQLNSGNNET